MQGVPQNEQSEFRGFTCKGFPKTSKASLGGSRARGNHTVTDYTSIGLGNINPYRYKGYYYDTETALVYCFIKQLKKQVEIQPVFLRLNMSGGSCDSTTAVSIRTQPRIIFHVGRCASIIHSAITANRASIEQNRAQTVGLPFFCPKS